MPYSLVPRRDVSAWAVFVAIPSLLLTLCVHAPFPAFALSLFVHLGVFALCGHLARWSRALARAIGGLALACSSLLVTVGILFRFRAGVDLTDGGLDYALRSPKYALDSVVEHGALPALLLAILVACGACAFGALTAVPQVRRWTRWRMVLLCVGLPLLGTTPASATTDARAAFALLRIARQPVSARSLPIRVPTPVARANAELIGPTILIINESLSAFEVFPCDQLVPSNVRYVSFVRARTTSTATNVAVPTILSGLAPHRTRDAYSRAPLVWDYAAALGFDTAFVSSQDIAWAGMRAFYTQLGVPRLVEGMESLGVAVNDGGTDDAFVFARARTLLSESERPMFLTLQLNSTHSPGWAPGLPHAGIKTNFEAITQRRAQARGYVAALTREFLTWVHGRFPSATVVIAADHGETLRHTGLRLDSFTEDVLRVPLLVHTPARMDELEKNRRARVSHIDILPTLLDAWGYPCAPLDGVSLFGTIPATRPLVSMSTGEIREWGREALVVVQRDTKWSFDRLGARSSALVDAAPGEREYSPTQQEFNEMRHFLSADPVLAPFKEGAFTHGSLRAR
jgi:hypothetical protein